MTVILFGRNDEHKFPSVKFQGRMGEAQQAIDGARMLIEDLTDHLRDYAAGYREMLRDIPEGGEWAEAHERATMQLERIEGAQKVAADLSAYGQTMGDDVFCLMLSMPKQPETDDNCEEPTTNQRRMRT
jgi:hypothetical protein